MPHKFPLERATCPRCLSLTAEYLTAVSSAAHRLHYKCVKCGHVFAIEPEPTTEPVKIAPSE